MNSGSDVGELAQQLFPGGALIEFDSSDFEGMLRRTQQLIDEGVETIYEATFRGNGIFVMCDILHKGEEGWEVYEVKSSTSVKEYHRNDLSIQWYALESLGLSLTKASVVHINNQYCRGEELDLSELFTITEITDEVVERQQQIPEKLNEMEGALSMEEPAIKIGGHCSSPFECDFSDHCWKNVAKDSVFNLYRMRSEKKFELYHQGVNELAALPEDTPLSEIQQLQIRALQNPSEPIIDQEIIGDFLKTISGPVSYLDFETYQDAVPRFEGQTPYQQVPFQFSLHIETEGEDGHKKIEHREFLSHQYREDPREEFAARLLLMLPKEGSIIAYNMGFEKRIIRGLAESYPHLSERLLALNERFVDLIVPFRNSGYYSHAMQGSFSIKSVLPALFPDDPELSYKSLNIQDGGTASETFSNILQLSERRYDGYDGGAVLDSIRTDLLAYCRLDTLAMVKIVEKLRGLSVGLVDK